MCSYLFIDLLPSTQVSLEFISETPLYSFPSLCIPRVLCHNSALSSVMFSNLLVGPYKIPSYSSHFIYVTIWIQRLGSVLHTSLC